MGNTCCGPDVPSEFHAIPTQPQPSPRPQPHPIPQPVYHPPPVVHQAPPQPQPVPVVQPIAQPHDSNSVRCELCTHYRPSQKYYHHLDVCHFAKYISSNEVVCLICLNKAQSLEKHASHMNFVHPYMRSVAERNIDLQEHGHELESHENIRGRVTPITGLDYYVDQSGYRAEIGGSQFEVRRYAGEVERRKYNDIDVKGEFVWRHIFAECPEANFYCLETVPAKDQIKVNSKLFTQI